MSPCCIARDPNIIGGGFMIKLPFTPAELANSPYMMRRMDTGLSTPYVIRAMGYLNGGDQSEQRRAK